MAVLLAQNNDVVILDIDPARVKKVNNCQSTVVDKDIQLFLEQKPLSLMATLNKHEAFNEAKLLLSPRQPTMMQRLIVLIPAQLIHW